jgi:N-acetylmuramoyl-L-alanine amidase
MKVLAAALAALAVAPTAHAAGVTIVERGVPLGQTHARTVAGALPRFDLVALHWRGDGVPSFRTRSLAGRWSAWQAADDDWGRSGRWRMQGTPSWVGASDAIQYRLRGRVTRLRAYFIWSAPERIPSRRLSISGSPPIIPRSGWGADEEIRRAPPVYADAVRYVLVHHTVNSNAYTPQQSAAIVRAIEVYHVESNGWNDIGYNFLVDKYGQIFEGRYGGIDRPVVGAHSAGFNTGSAGIAVLGTYSRVAITPAAKAALQQLISWRLDVAHVDPLSSVSVVSGGNPKFGAGTKVTLRAVSGHRDTYPTECPGNALYAQLPSIAQGAAALGLPKLYQPVATGTIGGPIRFTARLTTALPWTVTVVDAHGSVVASGSGNGSVVDWTWDATAAAPGHYGWTIAAGPNVRAATGTIGAQSAPLAITGAGASPAVVSSTSQITYTLSVAATVTATLADANGVPVASLFVESKPAGKQSFLFTVSPTVPDGPYTIQLQAQSADGQQATADVPIRIDRTVTDFSAAPAAISPNGDGVQDAVSIYFDLSRAASATLAVQRNGSRVTSLLSGSYAAATPVTTTWDGAVAGKPVRDGVYALALTTGGTTRTLPLAVDRRPPKLRVLSWSRLRFAVDEAATVQLVAAGRTYAKTVKAAGRVSFSVAPRPSHYVVRAQDLAGNVTTLRR